MTKYGKSDIMDWRKIYKFEVEEII
jgi:hypothetical protein